MELQDAMDSTVRPEDIKKPLSVVRKRLLTMLDRSLYHRLDHLQKVTIAKANLIAGICTAAIHTGYCKDALALYRQSLTLFRELNQVANSEGYIAQSADNSNIDPFILTLVEHNSINEQDPGKYCMFIVVIYYQMSLLYDKSLVEKVQKSRYYLLQALGLLVEENAVNNNKYCIETLQRLALFALETNKDDEYMQMMLITLQILRENEGDDAQVLEVQISFAQSLLSYGHKFANNLDPAQRGKFERIKSEYQKLLNQILCDAKKMIKHDETRQTLSKLLGFAKYLLEYQQLNESYKVYHCMRKMCDDTQINLDLDFMKLWIEFVKLFIAQIVKQNANHHAMLNNHNRPLWSEQILELCEFDVKVLEKIAATTDMDVGTVVYMEYIECANALIAININKDQRIIDRCKHYLNQATKSNKEQVTNDAMRILNSLGIGNGNGNNV